MNDDEQETQDRSSSTHSKERGQVESIHGLRLQDYQRVSNENGTRTYQERKKKLASYLLAVGKISQKRYRVSGSICRNIYIYIYVYVHNLRSIPT